MVVEYQRAIYPIIDNNFQKEEKVNKNKSQGLKMILKSPIIFIFFTGKFFFKKNHQRHTPIKEKRKIKERKKAKTLKSKEIQQQNGGENKTPLFFFLFLKTLNSLKKWSRKSCYFFVLGFKTWIPDVEIHIPKALIIIYHDQHLWRGITRQVPTYGLANLLHR